MNRKCYFCSREDDDEHATFHRIIMFVGRKIRTACHRCYNRMIGH